MAQPVSFPIHTSATPTPGLVVAMPNTKLWLLATIVSAFTTRYFVISFLKARTYQCTFCPKAVLLGVRMPQMHAIFLAAAASFFLVGFFSVSVLQLTRRIEQFFVD